MYFVCILIVTTCDQSENTIFICHGNYKLIILGSTFLFVLATCTIALSVNLISATDNYLPVL